MTDHPYDRSYFEEGVIGYSQYADWPVNLKALDEILKLKPESVLEIGCGRGYVVKKLNDAGVNAIGMDISEYCYATRATDKFKLHDICDTPWPFADGQFDLCFSMTVLEHIPEEKLGEIINEIHRVSKRSLHGISFNNEPNDKDVNRKTVKGKGFWIAEFNSTNDTVIDKLEIEKGAIQLPGPDGLVKLNVGSFTVMYHHGWINIDVIPLQKYAEMGGYAFLQIDLITKKLYHFTRNSVDVILLSHVLEHFDRPFGKELLEDCFRVLKDGGILRIAIPDGLRIANDYLNNEIQNHSVFNKGVEEAIDDADAFYKMLIEGHKTVYDAPSLITLLTECGFDSAYVSGFNESRSDALKKQTVDMYPQTSLYVEAKKTIHSWRAEHGDKLKIGLISTPFLDTPPKNYGGLELVVANLGKALAEKGHDVTVIATEGSDVPGCKMVRTIPAANTTQVDWKEIEKQHYGKYKELLNGFDIIHDNTWFGCAYLAKMENPGLKVLHTHHGHLAWNEPAVDKMNMVAISKFMRNQYLQQGWPSETVYNGIDIDKYPLRTEIGNELVFIGRIDMFKQPHMAISLAKKLNMKLTIIGGTFVQDKAYLEMIKQSCDGVNIRMIENATHQQKIDALHKAKALIFPSAMGEPFGLVAAEAMACGVPVVSTADGAIGEVVQHGVTGFVCKTFDEMVTGIQRIGIIDTAKCRNRVRDLFSKEVMAKNYESVYYDILSGIEW
jgi:glycosyltransferase involved in cell wall biosynthesis/predicted SAM-dependent methyltransferase